MERSILDQPDLLQMIGNTSREEEGDVNNHDKPTPDDIENAIR